MARVQRAAERPAVAEAAATWCWQYRSIAVAPRRAALTHCNDHRGWAQACPGQTLCSSLLCRLRACGLPVYRCNCEDAYSYCLSPVPYALPQVPQQYPPEVRDVLSQRRNSMLKYDFSASDHAEMKQRAKIFWTPMY